jgi:hypothetical protein
MAWTRASQEVMRKAEETSKSAKEAVEISARAAREAISRAEKVSQSARETAEASIRAAKEATLASKKAAKEAAETSIRVFEELMANVAGIAKTSQPLARQTDEPPTRPSTETDGLTKETDIASGEVTEALAKSFGKVISGAGASTREKKEAKEVQRRIETRLESLARMYSSNKDRVAGEEDEEEEED